MPKNEKNILLLVNRVNVKDVDLPHPPVRQLSAGILLLFVASVGYINFSFQIFPVVKKSKKFPVPRHMLGTVYGKPPALLKMDCAKVLHLSKKLQLLAVTFILQMSPLMFFGTVLTSKNTFVNDLIC